MENVLGLNCLIMIDYPVIDSETAPAHTFGTVLRGDIHVGVVKQLRDLSIWKHKRFLDCFYTLTGVALCPHGVSIAMQSRRHE